MAKSMPLNERVLDGFGVAEFFLKEMPRRTPPGKFYVYGRDNYIARDTPAGTLVVFHFKGRLVAHAKLLTDWKQPNDDPQGRPDAQCAYLFEDAHAKDPGLRLDELPPAWRAEWPNGRFDQSPRTLDPAAEAEFLARW